MKTLRDFLSEATYDPDLAGGASFRQGGEGGRKYAKRVKPDSERKRVKAVGGGKFEKVGPTKTRSDVGGAHKAVKGGYVRPEKPAGEVKKLSPREQQRKAYQERKAREASGKQAETGKKAEKKATEILQKDAGKKTVDPNYKPRKHSGYSQKERVALNQRGERELRNIFKKQEMDKVTKETGQKATGKLKTMAIARANQRMKS